MGEWRAGAPLRVNRTVFCRVAGKTPSGWMRWARFGAPLQGAIAYEMGEVIALEARFPPRYSASRSYWITE
jgi:hypothetical protein